MNDVFFFLHLLGAVGMGFYIVLPIMIGKATKLAGLGQGGLADGLVSANRIVQYALIVQLLTGGYMMSQSDYTVAWMIIVTVLFLAIAAISGIMSKPLKRIVASIQDGQSATGHIAKARTFSLIVLVLYVVVIYFMAFPMYE